MQLIPPNTYYWQITISLYSAAFSYLTYQTSVYCQLHVITH